MTTRDPSTDLYDALVVGAGPAGSWAAGRLAERGFAVVLADENSGGRDDVVCTGIIGSEAWNRFSLPAKAVRSVVGRADFLSPSGISVPYEPSEPFARVVDRVVFDMILASRAEEAGARLLRGWAARRVEREAETVRVGFETPEGMREIAARVLVVATGHQRWLHEAAGLGTPDEYVHGVHADVPFTGLEGAELYFGNAVAPGFFAWAIPFETGTARLGVLAPQKAHLHFERFLHKPAIRERLGFPEDELVQRATEALRSRAIVQGPVEPSVADRTLAVGEAAGQVKTTTAGGIYYGLRAAERAAEVLAERLPADRLDAASLAAYEEAWRTELMPEIEAGLELQRAVRGLSDAEIDRLFEALQGGLGAMVRAAVRFDWHRAALSVLLRDDRVRRVLDEDVA
ncbi:MAG: NAD(P)/FAD-dependent oxidoreductase [Gemmatimonadota bacterium]|nr:NAD(P)/FAD-dependent oxidoreductase [Gemmatimonadota bacterium]